MKSLTYSVAAPLNSPEHALDIYPTKRMDSHNALMGLWVPAKPYGLCSRATTNVLGLWRGPNEICKWITTDYRMHHEGRIYYQTRPVPVNLLGLALI